MTTVEIEDLIKLWEGRLKIAQDQYLKLCKRLSDQFGQEDGPDFEHSSETTQWISLRERIRVYKDVINDLRLASVSKRR